LVFASVFLTFIASVFILYGEYLLLLKNRSGSLPKKEEIQTVSDDGRVELTSATELLSLPPDTLIDLEGKIDSLRYDLLSHTYSATESLQTLNLLRRQRLRSSEKATSWGISCAALAFVLYTGLAIGYLPS